MKTIDESGDWRLGVAGDWHGNTGWARSAVAAFGGHGIENVFHVGDFGLGWSGRRGNQYLNEVNGACIKHGVKLFITPGNHENWDYINALEENEEGLLPITENIFAFPRGYRGTLMDKTFVSLGGAPSIDFEWRTQGVDWWAAEMITLEEAEAVAADGHADIMFTHDSPDGATDKVQRIIDSPSGWTRRGLAYAAEGRELMNIAVAGVRPKMFLHGHFHVTDYRDDGTTQWVSLNMDGVALGNLGVIDLNELTFAWIA